MSATHKLASVSSTWQFNYAQSSEHTTVTLVLQLTCQCGRSVESQSTFVFGSSDEAEAAVIAYMKGQPSPLSPLQGQGPLRGFSFN